MGRLAVSPLPSNTESNGTMASISYWFLSPSLMMAMIGKLREVFSVEHPPFAGPPRPHEGLCQFVDGGLVHG